MRNKQYAGNTLAEYALLLSLVAIASLGGMSLFGNTVSHFHGDVATHIATLTPFGNKNGMPGSGSLGANGGGSGGWISQGGPGGTGAGGDKSQAGNGWALNGADNSDAAMVGPDVQQANGGGSNITGSNGDDASVQDSYASTIATALNLQKLAEETTDPSLKAWFERAAENTMRLAKNQAALEYNWNTDLKDNAALVSFVGNSNISEATATNSMTAWQHSLQQQRNSLLSNATLGDTALAQEGLAMVAGVVQANKSEYGDALGQGSAGAGVYTPNTDNIKRDAIKAIHAGLASDSPALQSSLEGAASLKSTADSLP